MTQHGTSVVIKQTYDGLGAELRLLEMLQVVARDQKKQEKEAQASSIHSFFKQVIREPIPACIGLPDKDMHTYRELHSFLCLTWMSLACGKKMMH